MVKRLCLFTDSTNPSGMGEHMLTLAGELRDRYRISLVCPDRQSSRRLRTRAATLGLQVVPFEVANNAAEAAFRDWLRQADIDVLHCHAGIGWEGHHGIRAARAAGIPVVVRTEHLPYLITQPELRAEHARVVEMVDRVILVSEECRADFLRAGLPASKMSVVRNGITITPAIADRAGMRAQLDLDPETRIVLTIGRLFPQKGHEYLLRAVPGILERAPDVRFVWVGTGPLGDQLRTSIRAMGLQEQVRLVGHRDDVPDLLAAADLFALPSLFEGLPIVVLEAMGAGLPVVGTRVCGTSEAVDDGATGRLVPPGDPSALADAIIEVLTQPELAIRWGRAGRERVVRCFGAARMAKETAAIYECSPDAASSGDRESVPLIVAAN